MCNDDRSQDLDWENRVLCSDESCIGVIGADGCCKECGKPYEGEQPLIFTKSTDDVQPTPQPSYDDVASAAGENDQEASVIPNNVDEEWEQRVLCSDESCIGVIGPDGRCKECGLPFEGNK